MYFNIIFVILVFLGIVDSIYLIYKNRPNKTLTCPLNSDCNAVLQSKWNKFLGVKNEIWGLLYYIGILSLFGLLVYGFLEKEILFGAISFGVLYSGFLTYVQIFKIKEYCLYCLFSAGINILLLLTILVLL